jgi:hypothetical protein
MDLMRFAIIALTILLLSGCPASPPSREHREWISRLPAGNTLYLYVRNEPSSRMFFDLVAKNVYRQNIDIGQLVDNTRSLYGALRGEDYYLLLLGHYPSFFVGGGLDSRPDWKKEGPKIWTQAESRVTIALPEEYSMLVTNRDYAPFVGSYGNPAGNGVRLPDALEKELTRGLAGFFFPAFAEQGMPERIPFNKKRIPIGETWVTIRNGNGKYVVESAFNCGGEENARLFSASFRTFLLWILKEIKAADISPALKGTKILTADGYLLMDGFSLSEAEMRSALGLFTGEK